MKTTCSRATSVRMDFALVEQLIQLRRAVLFILVEQLIRLRRAVLFILVEQLIRLRRAVLRT